MDVLVLITQQSANHDKNTDWKVVGDSNPEITTANGKEMVNICDQAGLCLGNTWRNGSNRPLSLRCPRQATGSTALLLLTRTP